MEPGTLICGKYEIIRVIGHGGMSTVYLARDHITGQRYAIKDVERSGQDRDRKVVVQSLAVEGQMLKRLENPHLPKIYDIIEDTESFMLVMDFIEGESLDKVIARTGPQDVNNIFDWSIQVCDVLQYLHSQPQPIVYRDMKPANIILQPDGNIMLIDFGTARTQKIGQYMQSDTVCIGTEGFAAPEQFGGISQSDARTDVFCMGATIYNLLTGHSPCDPPKGILPLERFNPALSGTPLELIIRKCTRYDPNERYQSALELKADLELARSGGFDPGKRRGKTGAMSRGAWESQQLKGVNGNTGGLSGLLGKNRNQRTGETGSLTGRLFSGRLKKTEQPAFQEIPSNTGALTGNMNNPPEQTTYQYITDQEALEESKGWSTRKRLTAVFLAFAAVMLLMSIAFALIDMSTAAIVGLVLTFFCLILAGVFAAFEIKARKE